MSVTHNQICTEKVREGSGFRQRTFFLWLL